ncbi:MAG TPA: pyruvate kinase alpha/beta domain-containing protein [Candidatus Saccharicenans sp.]|nr:pyruvate kinase alpha/beta domain-containing protein [Candidatus Saccharicenans sp.]
MMCNLNLEARGQQVTALYFEEPGAANSEATLKRAAIRADELKIRQVVLPSVTGETAKKALGLFQSCQPVVVTHSTGFLKPNDQEMPEAVRQELQAAGAKVLTAQHAFGGVNRAVRKKFGTYELDEIIAYTLRCFGQGLKVAVEISLMAADAGLIRSGEPCLSLGGTERGVDTAVLLSPVNSQNFFDLKIMEILAKPGFYQAAEE